MPGWPGDADERGLHPAPRPAGSPAAYADDARAESDSQSAGEDVLKSAVTAASTRPGPLQDLYQGMFTRGMEELARATLTRKLAALTLHAWKTGDR